MGTDKVLTDLLQKHVKPFVKKIDDEHYYAQSYLQALGEAGYFQSEGIDDEVNLRREFEVVKETSKLCMSTGFVVWCYLAGLTYIRKSLNETLKQTYLSKFESGAWIAATGLSNPMKTYAGLEKLHLCAQRTADGYLISGTLPAVSNLARGHWFAVMAEQEDGQKIIALVSTEKEGLTLKEKVGFLGVNGSATYTCQFQEVFISDAYVLSTDSNAFVEKIRNTFVFYQIPLALGVIEATIFSIQKAKDYQFGGNRYLPVQAEELIEKYQDLLGQVENLLADFKQNKWEDTLEVRLQAALLALEATQVEMLHQGSAGYLQKSASSRRLRESYFYVNLTPTVRHLSKLLHVPS